MAEDEVVVSAVRGATVAGVELRSDAVRERDRARRAMGLGRPELSADEAPAHPQAAGEPVDVAPAQRDQLALS